MRLVKAKLYIYDETFSEEDQASVLAAAFDLFGDMAPVFKDGKLDNWHVDMIWDIDLLPVHLIKALHEPKALHLPQKLSDVFTARSTTTYNEHVKVVMPGIGMLQFDHVTAVYNLCTDELRSYLKLGWRIIAVCPQPDQRRPDYVLGRAGPEE